MPAHAATPIPCALSSSSSTAVGSLSPSLIPESFTVVTTIPPQGSYSDDIALLPAALPTKQTPASFAYRLDTKAGGNYEWMMVTFVPDDAGVGALFAVLTQVRNKMLQASSRAGLMKALGANNFKHDWFATSIVGVKTCSLTPGRPHSPLAQVPPRPYPLPAPADRVRGGACGDQGRRGRRGAPRRARRRDCRRAQESSHRPRREDAVAGRRGGGTGKGCSALRRRLDRHSGARGGRGLLTTGTGPEEHRGGQADAVRGVQAG